MTCASGFELLYRPYPYPREPFRLSAGELVGYEGRFFSIPAFGLLLDKRLFTSAASHPVATPIKLYVNKDAGLSTSIEPSLAASGYEDATPHYADYILDMRDLLEDVVQLHANDSEYSADDFFRAHMERNRSSYDLPNSSASGVSDLDYVHPAPANTVPVAPSSTTTSSTEIELGAQQFQDVDMDEVMWQPFSRPKSPETGPNSIPTKPFFPAALPNGALPTFSTLDEQKFGELGLNVSASGGVLVTGDALVEGTSIKLLTGSGQSGASEGDFVQNVEWAQFPCGDELNRYYETQNSGCINASGRQAIYEVPAGLSDDLVHLLDVSSAGTSGKLIQNYPANYNATSGIDQNGTAHAGVHTVNRLLYALGEMSANTLAVGRSLINGKKVFGHFGGIETSTKGFSINGRLKYTHGNTVYAYGGITDPFQGIGNNNSLFEWGSFNQQLSPVSWSKSSTSALQPRVGVFGGPNSTTWDVGDIMAASDGVCWFKRYAQWGTMDRMVFPGLDKAGGGSLQQDTISYETHVYREGTDNFGHFAWVELAPPESPIYSTQTVYYWQDTYSIGNIMTAFYAQKLNHGFVHINGETYIQWSPITNGVHVLPRTNMFGPISSAARSTRLTPSTTRSVSTAVVGFFPSWKIRLYVTTNNQITVPDSMAISPAASATISFASNIPMTTSQVSTFGPATWDATTGLNYLYFVTNGGQYYFAKMNTSFQIVHINRVASTDVILSGRSAILSI